MEDENGDRQRNRGGSKRVPTVSVIGGSSVGTDSEHYRIARRLGRELVDRGFRIITGGRGGVMEAACRGAYDAEGYVEGRTVGILPGRDTGQANPYVDIAIPTGMNIARNAIIAHSDAVIAVGGGSGTLAELAMAWQLGRVVVALEVDGWSGQMAGVQLDGRIPPSDEGDDCIRRAIGAVEAVDIVERQLDAAQPTPREF